LTPRRKWKRFGRWVFYTQFIHYFFFLISLTGYIENKLDYESFQATIDNPQDCSDTVTSEHAVQVAGFRVCVIIGVIFGVIIEVSQIIRMKARYIRFSNFVDWILYTGSIIFILDQCYTFETAGCKGLKCWQWPVGSFLITLAWLNFLTYFRYVPYFGIFILMFNYIINTVAKFAVILVIFILAFGFGFHILFINQVRAWVIDCVTLQLVQKLG
jgi:hypothetical protein